MKNDLRFALRMIFSHKWFSLAVVVTLALGIDINTTVVTLVNAVLFKPVPLPGGERLVTVSNQNLNRASGRPPLSWADFRDYKAESKTFAGFEGLSGGQAVISEQGNPPE